MARRAAIGGCFAAAFLFCAASAEEGAGADAKASSSIAASFEMWRMRVTSDGFAAVEETLLGALNDAGARDAVHFYGAHGLWPEALALIGADGAKAPEIVLIAGAAQFRMGRWNDAVSLLSDKSLRDAGAAIALRGMAKARLGAINAAAEDLFNPAAAAPSFLGAAAAFHLACADVALRKGDAARAEAALTALRDLALTARERDERRLAEARLMLATEKRRAARDLFGALLSAPAPVANFARLERIADRLAQGEIAPGAALAEIEPLMLSWRGGAFERDALEFKATLYDQSGDVAAGFKARRRLAASFPRSDAAARADKRRAAMLPALFEGSALSPLTAAETFYENIDVAPPGGKGDRLIRRVADELVALDLLREAAELMRHQTFERLRGADRAEAAAALARIYIDADRPRAAVQTLRATRFARLPAALNDRRRWLEARALIESKDDETAIVLLERDESAEAASLRGDIYWRAENWSAAGGAFARAAFANEEGAPIEGEAAFAALKAVSAFALAGDDAALAAFYAKAKDRLNDQRLRSMIAEFIADDARSDPAQFFAAYQDYFNDTAKVR